MVMFSSIWPYSFLPYRPGLFPGAYLFNCIDIRPIVVLTVIDNQPFSLYGNNNNSLYVYITPVPQCLFTIKFVID